MAYDFDWDGETLELGDEEAQTFVLPEEPTANQQGVDPPGPLSANTDLMNFGVFNGNFRLGPPKPADNLDVASSTASSNFMPGWRFVQSSNSNITASQVRNTGSPSGSNLRFTFAAGAAGDEAYVEQIVDIGGSRQRWVADTLRFVVIAGASNTGTFTAEMRSQYLTTNGNIIDMPAEQTVSLAPAAGTLDSTFDYPEGADTVPGNARFLRLRLVARRGGAANGATGTLDFTDVRRDRASAFVRLPDIDDPTTYAPAQVFQSNGTLTIRPAGEVSIEGQGLWIEEWGGADITPGTGYQAVWPDDSGRLWSALDTGVQRLISHQLVPLAFVFIDIPANATTALNPSDNALAISVNRITMPWGGSVVGMSYRLTDAPTAGTITIRATVNGSNVWSPFGALGSAGAASGATSQGVGTDNFSAGDTLGVEVVTTAGYLPTTRDIHAILWAAVEYTGA